MSENLYTLLHEHFYAHILLIGLSTAVMLLSMLIDLITGTRKAKVNGQEVNSRGLKTTAKKATRYFTPFAILASIDLLCAVVIPYPVFSLLWAAYCAMCEFKSVREKAWQKAEIARQDRTMRVLLENSDELKKALTETFREVVIESGANLSPNSSSHQSSEK